MKRIFLVAAALAVAPLAFGQAGAKPAQMKKDDKSALVHKASGKVVRVDPAKGSVTIAHGPVESLRWPSMTMPFKVGDKAMLEKLKPGEPVEFGFVQSGRDYTITELR